MKHHFKLYIILFLVGSSYYCLSQHADVFDSSAFYRVNDTVSFQKDSLVYYYEVVTKESKGYSEVVVGTPKGIRMESDYPRKTFIGTIGEDTLQKITPGFYQPGNQTSYGSYYITTFKRIKR